MTALRHGFSIGIERMNDEFFLTLKAKGKLTHSDYLAITPVIDSALSEVKQPKIKALFDATELEGWELSAAWDDLKLGLKHGNQFVKIALYGNKGWQEIASKIGNWFIAGETRYFDNEPDALAWLHQ
ncbi:MULTISPECIES: STAS/SEC14 domain-containing protein [unclassified Shewanella]|uniref:STAS/SEC14 domain-containing protein n=1 Tax=unclassified Shewanella TaxID=196818 RepID=UPI001BBF24FB|nr:MULTISPECIES: STAS/SEC14 domain-containing protein [unclassified Shewanella]GIU15306.1 STAS/SEC14 domain-containing protein [Shewanella sp. MBTL60-112-B1]GIU34741.1 STAS/SEC14 domain-containing protein [Shewanella sp. MBTL60-112-B2]